MSALRFASLEFLEVVRIYTGQVLIKHMKQPPNDSLNSLKGRAASR